MEKSNFGSAMTKFYEHHNFRKGNTPGGGFVGKVLREMISPEKLQILSLYLEDQGEVYIRYLSAIRELYSVCVQPELKDDFKVKVENYKEAFEAMHQECSLSETLKVHVLSSHCSEFLSVHGHTLAHLSDEPIESCHGKLRFFERRSNHICRKNLVGRYKGLRTRASFTTFNAKKIRSIVKQKEKRKRFNYFVC